MNTETNSQDQGKEAKKVLSNFDNVVKKLTAVVNGGENLKPVRKVKQDATKKLDNLEISKKKEFNTTAAKLFAKIDGIDSMTQEFYGAMNAAQDAVIAEEEQAED